MTSETQLTKQKQLDEIAEELANLVQSPLYPYRQAKNYYPVPGEGNPDADVLFIGEAPGQQEAKTGRPFVGRSGKFLDQLLESIGLNRADVFITNIVKDRPPENRDPSAVEIELYSPLLIRQVKIIQPGVIATLGRFSMEFILTLFNIPVQDQKISALHGKPLRTVVDGQELVVLPLFHPAVALYNQSQQVTWNKIFRY